MLRIITTIFLLVVSLTAQIYTQKDVDVCNAKFKLAVDSNLSEKPINEIVLEIAESFIGLDYEAGTLDQGDKEELIVHLTGLDCYTFLESALTFSRLIKRDKTTFEDYENELAFIRYRNGKVEGYPSRLHYFSDWIYESEQKNIGKDITKDIGGIPYKKNVSFMSSHPDYYKRLKGNQKFINEMKTIESDISERDYYFIPQDKITDAEDKIESGDIIGITTNIDGLDIAHTGIAVKKCDGKIYFLHSPNVGKKVQITDMTLSEYINKNKRQTGIIVFRPI